MRALESIQSELDAWAAAKERLPNLARRPPTDSDRLRVEQTLHQLGALPALVHRIVLDACDDPTADVRLAAVEAASPDRFDSSANLPVFRRLLQDPDDRVRSRAVYRLGQLREDGREAVPEIVRLLRTWSPEENDLSEP